MTRKESYQHGTLVLRKRKRGPDVWELRHYRYDLQGNATRPAEFVATVDECPTKAKAELKAAEIRKRINEEGAVVYLSDLAEKYETDDLPTIRPHSQRTVLSNLRHIRARWGKTRLDQMTKDVMSIQLWVNTLKDEQGNEYSKQTRQHVRNLLHRLFDDAMLWGLISLQKNPIDLVEVRKGAPKKHRKLVLTPAQLTALMADPDLLPHVKHIIVVAVCTGMRISEILGLRWEDIDFRRGIISIRRSSDGKTIGATKSDESQQDEYPMHKVLSEALLAWKRDFAVIEGWVFGSALTGRPFHGSVMQAKHLKPAGKRIGIPNLGWHTFRHTYRALLSDLGEPIEVQQALMRHSDVAQTLEYGKFSQKRAAKLRQANAKVVRMIAGGSQ